MYTHLMIEKERTRNRTVGWSLLTDLGDFTMEKYVEDVSHKCIIDL